MNPSFFLKNMGEAPGEQLQDYFLKKLPRIEKLLSHFPEDAYTIQVKGEHFTKHSAFEVEITLKLPTGTHVAKEASHLITKAVDLAVDRLKMQLAKSAEQLRSHRTLGIKQKIRAGVLEPEIV